MNPIQRIAWIAAVSVATSTSFLVSAQEKSQFVLTGHVKNVTIKEVYLVYFGSKGLIQDSARIVDGHYTFTGTPSGDIVGSLSSAAPGSEMPDNTLSVMLHIPEHFTVTHTPVFTNIVITGSPANTEYHKLLARQRIYDQQLKELGAKLSKAMAQKNKTAEQQIRAEIVKKEAGSNDWIYGGYMRANPSSPLLSYAFNNVVGDGHGLTAADARRLQPLFNMLPEAVRSAPSGKNFQGILNNLLTFDENTAIGKAAPDFTQNDTSAHPVTLSSFRGKYVLLDFWASWCGPCRQENPHVVAAYQKYHEKGFEILGVSLDQNGASWKKAIRDDRLNWVHVSDLSYWNNPLVRLYGITGVPQNFLIDPQGKIIARGLRGEELDGKLSEIYK